jgi:DNA-binding LytR/AlgR family response regulator
MQSKIPAYMYEKGNVIRLILLTATFALLFINIFKPYNSTEWYKNLSDTKYFFFSSLLILTGMLVVIISRIIMLKTTKENVLYVWQFALHVIGEVASMSVLFTIYAVIFPRAGDKRDVLDIFFQSSINTAWLLLLPYSILWLYFSWRDKKELLEKMSKIENESTTVRRYLIAFPDEKGDLKISLDLEHLLYVDSSENYATIHYMNKSKLSHFLIRNSLKWMDENLTKETPLVRCHRSYIVNLDKVKVLRKTKDGIFLEMDAVNTPDIPVSKTYYQHVMDKFSNYSV